ncbi:MAG: hypothetical protein CVU09_14590 [Bacteroidetes bacterium HGW-Bacteroidetes-4]|jgi:hypothetical protein|nr:MAG: hypothetical protein CVU09_14590 [Bacteroidetes bacterium HGW-Bacteroidetes-4]
MKTFLILKETIVFLVMERFGIRFFCTGIIFFIASGFISCGKKFRSGTTTDVSTYQEVRLVKIKFNFNQSFKIREVKQSSSMAQIHVQGIGFQQANQILCFDKVSPFESALVADIDNNGFEELYVITRSTGKKKPPEFMELFRLAVLNTKQFIFRNLMRKMSHHFLI